jgi:hypothetical protein
MSLGSLPRATSAVGRTLRQVRLMSALGHKRTLRHVGGCPLYPRKRTSETRRRNVALQPWSIGPVGSQHYVWIGGWAKRPIDLIEVSTSDVSRILCGGADNDTGSAGQATGTKVNQETNATHALASHLRKNHNLKREEAVSWCKDQGLILSARGFQYRAWPTAREEAGLPRTASPGRKNKSSR